VRLKIVVHDPSWLLRARAEATDLLVLLGAALRRLSQFLCALRGHDYLLQAQRRRLALHCRACGHTTPGWDLSDPTPRLTASEGPRYLELVRRRS
jgi:hypothetical protein